MFHDRMVETRDRIVMRSNNFYFSFQKLLFENMRFFYFLRGSVLINFSALERYLTKEITNEKAKVLL